MVHVAAHVFCFCVYCCVTLCSTSVYTLQRTAPLSLVSVSIQSVHLSEPVGDEVSLVEGNSVQFTSVCRGTDCIMGDHRIGELDTVSHKGRLD